MAIFTFATQSVHRNDKCEDEYATITKWKKPLDGFRPRSLFLQFCLQVTALFAFTGKGFPVMIVHTHEGVPPCIVGPPVRRLHRRARHPGAFQKIQRCSQNGALHIGVSRFPAWVPQRKISKHKARDTALFHNVSGAAHHNGGNAVIFQIAGNQTHGLVADRSECHQDRRINTVFAAPFQNLRAVSFDRPVLAVIGRHTVKPGGCRSDASVSGIRGQAV